MERERDYDGRSAVKLKVGPSPVKTFDSIELELVMTSVRRRPTVP
jgi:hypothetical protein